MPYVITVTKRERPSITTAPSAGEGVLDTEIYRQTVEDFNLSKFVIALNKEESTNFKMNPAQTAQRVNPAHIETARLILACLDHYTPNDILRNGNIEAIAGIIAAAGAQDTKRLDFIEAKHTWLTRSRDDAGTDACTARGAIDAATKGVS